MTATEITRGVTQTEYTQLTEIRRLLDLMTRGHATGCRCPLCDALIAVERIDVTPGVPEITYTPRPADPLA